MTDKQKIKLWAKGRLFELLNGIGEQDAKSVLTGLLSFLGSDLESDLTHSVTKISDQESPVSDDIEKEADKCWDYVFSALGWDENSLMTMNHKKFLAFACHFAEWQKKMDADLGSPAYERGYCDGRAFESKRYQNGITQEDYDLAKAAAYEAGKQVMKRQMIKDAVGAVVSTNIDGYINIQTGFVLPEEVGNVKFGDKVKLIITKEE